MIKYILLVVLAVISAGCINITPGPVESSSRDELLLELMKQQKSTKSPAVMEFHIDPITMAGMSPEQIRAIGDIARAAAEAAANTPKDEVQSSTNTKANSSIESSYSKKESILAIAFGSLILLFVVVAGVKWFSSTMMGRVATQAGKLVSDRATSRLKIVGERMAQTTSDKEMNELRQEESVILKDLHYKDSA